MANLSQEQFDITLKQVPVADTASAVNQVMAKASYSLQSETALI